jgi:N-acetyl-anhydromuramyl-L-alanine amidase AmpD
LWAAAATSIIIAGQPYDVGRPVVLWCDAERGFNGYAESCVEPSSMSESVCCARSFKRYGARAGVRTGSLADLQRTVGQLVLHHDGCVNSRSCFRSMHDMPRADGGCGLSAHFMIDADGTIYQTLDVAERAMHAGPANQGSVGVELCNRGDASRDELDRLPPDYRTRPVRTVVINERVHQAFDFRPEQYASVTALARVLLRTLPQIQPTMPRHGGKPLLATLADPLGFRGIVGHFHVDADQRKWDPGAFDWGRLVDDLSALYLPLPVRGQDRFPQDDLQRLQSMTRAALRNVEEHAARSNRGGGLYPVALGGLWDPRISLVAAPGAATPVRAPARGVVVAARLEQDAAKDAVRGAGFVLVRHEERLQTPAGELALRYFTRLSGLAAGPAAEMAVWWQSLAGRADGQALRGRLAAGEVVLLDQPVAAGDVVGAVGGAGGEGRVRVEVFTAEPLPAPLAASFVSIDARGEGSVCGRRGVWQALAVSQASAFDQKARDRFLADGGAENRQLLRRLTVRSRLPFAAEAGGDDIGGAPALAGLTTGERRRLFERVVAPERFSSAKLVRHAGLPESGEVHFHHPITFWATLAAHRGGLRLRWSSADLAPGAMPAVEERGRAALDAFAATPPTAATMRLGPIVRPSFRVPERHEIPLVDLPPLEGR